MADPAPSAEAHARAQDTLDFIVGMVEAEAFARRSGTTDADRVPVVVVAGFLGAGKTTLMRRLLTGRHGLRLAAIVNDFGALNIDAALIRDVSDDAVALDNGCVCCSQAGGLARALIDATLRAERPETIVVEASGVADPWALGQVAEAAPGVRLDCVVTVVDAAAAPSDAALDFLLARQVRAADLLLLNKIDAVSEAEAARAHARLAELAPRAQILRTVECAVPVSVVLERAGRSAPTDPGAEDGVADDSLFETTLLRADAPVDRAALEARLATLPEGVFRMKGFLRLADAPEIPALLQAVGRRWRWEAAGEVPGPGEVVVIARAGAVGADALAAHFAPAGLSPA